MSYNLNVAIGLGNSRTGMQLRIQLVDSSGEIYGEPFTSNIFGIGNGFYLWNATLEDHFSGGAKITSVSDINTVLAFLAINPQEAENMDVKVSENAARTTNINVGLSSRRG